MTDPIIGFRCWHVSLVKPVLRSVAMTYDWPQDDHLEAICMSYTGAWYGVPPPKEHHGAPKEECRCGFYARTKVKDLMEEYPYYPLHGYYRGKGMDGFLVMGAILMWGDVFRGAKVIRAQNVRILCLTDLPDPWYTKLGPHDPSRVSDDERHAREVSLDLVCQRYGVPMVPYESVEMYAGEFGELT